MKRVHEDYWKIYENWLNMLIDNSPIFLMVHENNKDYYEDIIHFIENTTKLNIQSKSKKWINNSCLNMSFDYDAKDAKYYNRY